MNRQARLPDSRQRGAVLMVGLILLVVITVLGVNVMNQSQLELKISHNFTQKVASFEAAESVRISARQAADAIADALDIDPTTFPSSASGIYNVGGPGTTVASPAVTTSTFWTASPPNYASVGANGKYVLEYLGQQAMELDDDRTTGVTTDLHVFRLTMRGTAGAGANTAIQALYVTN
jgi:type IV pilus assembly protein PilX